MIDHNTRRKLAKNAKPGLGWTFGQFLPELGEPLILKMIRIQKLDAEVKALRTEVSKEINERWTKEEIYQARQTVQNLYRDVTGNSWPLNARSC